MGGGVQEEGGGDGLREGGVWFVAKNERADDFPQTEQFFAFLAPSGIVHQVIEKNNSSIEMINCAVFIHRPEGFGFLQIADHIENLDMAGK